MARRIFPIQVGVPIINDYKVYDFKMEWRLGFFF
jgi:hypothetical protein